jgi:hypothetical protein
MTKYYGGKSYGYYRCNAFHAPIHYGFRCSSRSYRVEPVEKAVWEWAKGLLLDPEVRDRGIEDARARDRERLQPKLARLEINKMELKQLEAKKQNYIRAVEDGMPFSDIATDYATVNEEIKKLEQALINLDREIEVQMMTPEVEKKLNTLGDEVKTHLEFYEDDPAAQRPIFQQLNMQVTLIRKDEQVWAECECLLGSETLPVGFKSQIDLAIARG